MAGEAKQLRDFIDVCLDRSDRASLVDVIAHFDHQNHLIPSTWRLNMALAELPRRYRYHPTVCIWRGPVRPMRSKSLMTK